MKLFYNYSRIMLLLLGSILFSCNPYKGGGDATESTEEAKEHEGEDHVHTFACPMHPEMQGHEGEKCNICGMPLEHMDHVPVKGNYMMEFKTPGTAIVAGKPVGFSFIPKNKDNINALVPLDVEHEKKIHLIVVSEDLSWFD